MPPDADYLTDKEQFGDNLGTSVISDVAGTVKITIPDDNDSAIISGKKKSICNFQYAIFQTIFFSLAALTYIFIELSMCKDLYNFKLNVSHNGCSNYITRNFKFSTDS